MHFVDTPHFRFAVLRYSVSHSTRRITNDINWMISVCFTYLRNPAGRSMLFYYRDNSSGKSEFAQWWIDDHSSRIISWPSYCLFHSLSLSLSLYPEVFFLLHFTFPRLFFFFYIFFRSVSFSDSFFFSCIHVFFSSFFGPWLVVVILWSFCRLMAETPSPR